MPKKFDECVKDVKKKITKGELAEEYTDKNTGKKKKSNPYAICKARIK
jgi:hypothetical protein